MQYNGCKVYSLDEIGRGRLQGSMELLSLVHVILAFCTLHFVTGDVVGAKEKWR